MKTVKEILAAVQEIRYCVADPQVSYRSAMSLGGFLKVPVKGMTDSEFRIEKSGAVRVGMDEGLGKSGSQGVVFIQLVSDGRGSILTDRPNLLYGFIQFLLDRMNDDAVQYKKGCSFEPAFHWQRVVYDFFLTQEGRIQKNMDREAYVRQLAASGMTHIEVNGLAAPMGMEPGVPGEAYPMFYTYCPALDQFVSSDLNKGVYPDYWLSANLKSLKKNARLAREYGLKPGLTCFEPRSVPDSFFQKYPMLRGPRVDHPFRSFKPRYAMTLAHPKVLEHYAEMLENLLTQVPDLTWLTIWTNDSGAGFEHTRSLYAGRNGGPYLIREWRDDDEIARQAGENVIRFFGCLRDAGRRLNPDFRIITRLESFYGEHDVVWNGLGEGVEAEAASFIAKGWEMPYTHPSYPDSHNVNGGSVYQLQFDSGEKEAIHFLGSKGAHAHFYTALGPQVMFAPLIATPYPTLTYRRLKTLHHGGATHLARVGGVFPETLAPFQVNEVIARRFQWQPELDIEETVRKVAIQWVGEQADSLVQAWQMTEEAILAYPNTIPLYATFGFSWYRLWVRPLVPNIEAIPESDRSFYERFMCTTPHNPNNVDLSRDVLFKLTTPDHCFRDLPHMDNDVLSGLGEAVRILTSAIQEVDEASPCADVLKDQWVRIQALRCWMMTQRNVIAWIVSVHGFIASDNQDEKTKHRLAVGEQIQREINNTQDLMALWETRVPFMITTDQGETPLIHGDNLPELWEKRIELMTLHADDEPYIDPDYMMRRSGEVQT